MSLLTVEENIKLKIYLMNYIDYLAENLDRNVSYSEYLAENLDNRISIRKSKIKNLFY